MFTMLCLRLSIVIIAGFSALSAVTGLGAIFHAIFWPIVCVALGLELAKYSAVSYAYQEWTTLSWRLKIPLVGFIVTLTLFTSLGIFGYLGTSFQTSFLGAQQNTLTATQLTKQRDTLEARLKEMDAQVSNLPEKDAVRGRMRLMAALKDERASVQSKLAEVQPKIDALQTGQLELQAHLGPITYFAQIFKVPVEQAVSWLILVMALCLDPFAMYLTILSNRKRTKNEKLKEDVSPVKDVSEPQPETPPDAAKHEPDIRAWSDVVSHYQQFPVVAAEEVQQVATPEPVPSPLPPAHPTPLHVMVQEPTEHTLLFEPESTAHLDYRDTRVAIPKPPEALVGHTHR